MTYWNCWTSTMYNDGSGPAYIIHAFVEDVKPSVRTLCGVKWAETGLLKLGEFEPGCKKCRRILRKLGLIK